jgi:uncharacterized protein
MQIETTYFDKPGHTNTNELLQAVKKRLAESEIKYVVVASTSGKTALKTWEVLKDSGIKIVCVGEHTGFWGGDEQKLSPEMKKKLQDKGIEVVICAHALSGIERSITNKLGGVSRVELIAHLLRLFGTEGVKVAVECAIMAADCNAIPTDQEVISIGGTGGGADTAIILKPAHMNNFFDLEIREIIAKPRQRK